MKSIFYILIAIIPLLATCKGKSTNEKTASDSSVAVVNLPDFSADSAYRYIQMQVEFGARVPNTKEHTACANYLSNQLEKFGATVTVQEANVTAFDGTILKAKNIIGSYNLEQKTRILLFAHWDTRPWADHDSDTKNYNTPVLGANDGASGVGVLLEMARLFQKQSPDVGIDIIFFDAEDYGVPAKYATQENSDSWCLGSQYWAKNKHIPNYHARYGILLDMVGAKDAKFYRENISDHFAKYVVDKVWDKAIALGFGNYFVNESGGWITDDHLYVNKIAGIPSIDIIQYNPGSETGFGDYWHTIDDTMENIDKNTLTAVGTTIVNVVYNEKP